MRPLVRYLCLLLLAGPAWAQQDAAPVRRAIDGWLAIQTKGLPGRVSWEIGTLDPGNQLGKCANFDISRPAGARPWGRTHVMVRCLGPVDWRIYVPVQVRVSTDYLISARPIAQGQTIAPEDLATETGDLAELPASILIDPARAVGKIAASSIPAGRPLRSDLLKSRTVIQSGQAVRIISRGPGFSVTNEGRALANAQEGQVIQVRLASGQVISGIAQTDGTVEIGY